MAEHYKLQYFPLRGLGELPRLLLHLAGQSFEDDRIQQRIWPELKASTPFGTLPVLEEDGDQLSQSGAIIRYLAHKFGFDGDDEWERAQIDALYCQIRDFYDEVRPWFLAVTGRGPGEPAELYEKLIEPLREKLFALLERYLMKSDSGYLVGKHISYVDLLVAEHLETMDKLVGAKYTAGRPLIAAIRQKVYQHPRLTDYIRKRPQSDF